MMISMLRVRPAGRTPAVRRQLIVAALIGAAVPMTPILAQQPKALGTDRTAKIESLLAESRAAEQRGDMAAALELFGKALDINPVPDAMHALGHEYEKQAQIPKAKSLALRWYARAAAQGHGESASHLVKALERDALLSNEDYAVAVDGLGSAVQNFMYFPGTETLARLRKKQEAAKQCALKAVQGLGYKADDFSQFASTEKTKWYKVRTGNDTQGSGDTLAIYGASRGPFGSATSRLSIHTSGFTSIKHSRLAAGGNSYIPTKNYEGYVANGSAQGRADAEAILKRCGSG